MAVTFLISVDKSVLLTSWGLDFEDWVKGDFILGVQKEAMIEDHEEVADVIVVNAIMRKNMGVVKIELFQRPVVISNH